LSSCISSQDEIGSEAALDTLSEIGGNHFVARRAMLLRMAERAARKGGAYSARFTEFIFTQIFSLTDILFGRVSTL